MLMTEKRKNVSKTLALLLALAMLLAFFPAMASAATYGDLEVSIPSGENVSLTYVGSSGTTYTFNVTSEIAGYYPSVFSLQIAPDSGHSVSGITATNGTVVTLYEGTYYLATLAEGTTSTITITSSGGYTYALNCSQPDGGSTGSDSGIYAFLPAPGQFVNEGLTSGGWGTIYTTGQTAVKDLVDSKATTGVSLGFFGGYVVLDYGTPTKDAGGNVTGGIYNDSTNPYGVDFILYGNAFSGNSEPGCVQVSKDGVNWYDIAGSKYYDSDTVKNYYLTYTNPTPADDGDYSYGRTQTTYTGGVSYTGSSSGTVTYNSYHNHSWFPLYCNYFTPVIQSLGALDKTSVLPFADYTRDTTNGSTLTLRGVMLGDATNTQTGNYTFGYCDVHANGSATSTAYNPYTATASTTGGDPIDISWAVNSSGEPVFLDSIRFIRVYTGAKYMNGVFGEISTEVCGSYRATGTGGGAATTDLVVKDCDVTPYTVVSTSNMSTQTINISDGETHSYSILSAETKVFLNGTDISSVCGNTDDDAYYFDVTLTSGQTEYYQIITQNGTESPYITLLKFVRS